MWEFLRVASPVIAVVILIGGVIFYEESRDRKYRKKRWDEWDD